MLVHCVLALLDAACFTPYLLLLCTREDLHPNHDKICTQTTTAQRGFDPAGRPYDEESFLTGPNSMHNPNSILKYMFAEARTQVAEATFRDIHNPPQRKETTPPVSALSFMPRLLVVWFCCKPEPEPVRRVTGPFLPLPVQVCPPGRSLASQGFEQALVPFHQGLDLRHRRIFV